MEKPEVSAWVCPRCGKETTDFPALSRRDNETEICSACAMEEALIDFFFVQKEK